MMMMHSGMNMMHGDGSMNAQQHANLAQTNASAITKQQQQQAWHIKRPMNAFILWSRTQRPNAAAEHLKMPKGEYGKRLGADWKRLTADEKKIFFDEAKLLREQHSRDHSYSMHNACSKPKPSTKSTEPAMPCAPPFFQSGYDARAFMANPQSYDIDNSSNVVANHVGPYGMHFDTYPASYSGDPQGGDNQQQLSVTSGQHQGTHKMLPHPPSRHLYRPIYNRSTPTSLKWRTAACRITE